MLLAGGALLAGAGNASAHATLVSTDPAPGAVLNALPAQITLTFAEPVQPPADGVTVLDPAGLEIGDGPAAARAGGGSDTVRVGLRPGQYGPGSYTVAWRVVSTDTHPVTGAFVFSVGHPSAASAAPAATSPGDSATVAALYVVVRMLAYGSFAAMIGAAALLPACRPAGATRRIGFRTAAAGWTGLLVSTVATLLIQGPYGRGTGLADVLDPTALAATLRLPLGSALVARLALLAVAAVHLLWLRRDVETSRRHRVALGACGAVLAAGIAATWSVSGHGADGPQPLLGVAADAAHLVAMGVWLGGLLVLAVVLARPPERVDVARGPDATVGRFSPIAFGCVVVLVATGCYQAWRQLGSVSAVVDTGYGRLLLVKVVAVAALLGVAALSRRAWHRSRELAPARAVAGPAGVAEPAGTAAGGSVLATLERAKPPEPPPGRAALARTVLFEVGLAAAVLGVTAILVGTAPGRAAGADPEPASVSYDTGGPGGTGSLTVHTAPARTGPNRVEITVRGATGAPVDPAELDVEAGLPDRRLGPLELPVRRHGPGDYRADAQIPLPGTWQLAVTVRTSETDQSTVRLPVAVH